MSATEARHNKGVPSTELLLARISCGRIGIPLSKIRRVFLVPALQRVPSARPGVLGCAEIEGEAIVFIGAEADKAHASPTDIGILVEDHPHCFALVVDSVGEIVEAILPGGEIPECAGVHATSIDHNVVYIAAPGDLVSSDEVTVLAEIAKKVLDEAHNA